MNGLFICIMNCLQKKHSCREPSEEQGDCWRKRWSLENQRSTFRYGFFLISSLPCSLFISCCFWIVIYWFLSMNDRRLRIYFRWFLGLSWVGRHCFISLSSFFSFSLVSLCLTSVKAAMYSFNHDRRPRTATPW